METIVDRRVRFGELAGPLVHGSTFFDWQLIATQEVVAMFDYSFEKLLAAGEIPFAPVAVSTSVERYPTVGDTVTVNATPRRVGDSSVEFIYEITDGDGDRFATARMTHVSISDDGTALPLPDRVRAEFADASVDRTPTVGPQTGTATAVETAPSFSSSFEIRSPHIEGVDLAYFEEYPRFADIALEEFLAEQGSSLDDLRGEEQPYRIRDWQWEFTAPVAFESTLQVTCDVLSVDRDTIRVAHEFSSNGQTNIEGVTEYGCFDRTGAPVPFDDELLAPFER